jgi:uncharacterized membrane protein
MALTVVFLVLGMGVVAFGILHLIGVSIILAYPLLKYRPLFPWFGVVLLGLFAGNVLYGGGKRPAVVAKRTPAAAKPLLPLGRNSLFIYLIHQPILIALLAAFGVVEIGVL